ncbi:SDR family NAD(P)-dependent oxidoreductase [Undibacterium arcticum]|uniref:SDR family NAD(P)-dependent oxidoreductase n=1 Tax=Undibacterium arcticum TaxID=1762892 RepID=A0ABV7EYZ9_9BURK
MSGRLQNKVALITGGGTGIGAAAAERFAQEGATVVICGRRADVLEAKVNAIRNNGGRADWVRADVSDEAAFAQAVEATVDKQGRLDILVNNAAAATWGMIETQPTSEWHACFRASLDSAFFGTRAVLPHMKHQGGGAIVNVASVCGLLGTPGMAAYTAAKAGLINFTRTAALEGAGSNIRVNVVIPGVVMTPWAQEAHGTEAAMAATARGVPLKRIGEPRELASAILFLASDEASYITGAGLVVDGGKTCELVPGAADFTD